MSAEVTNDKIDFGTSTNCHYVTYMHVVTSVFYATTLAAVHTFAVIRNIKGGDFE